MMIDSTQLRTLIRETLQSLDRHSLQAENLLLGTACQESHCGTYIEQLGEGPALGIFQMEPATERDIWENYIVHRQSLQSAVASTCGRHEAGQWLKYDLAYQICMARIHYLRVPKALPAHDDIQGLAHYWKKYYNTNLGRGTEEEFIDNFNNLR